MRHIDFFMLHEGRPFVGLDDVCDAGSDLRLVLELVERGQLPPWTFVRFSDGSSTPGWDLEVLRQALTDMGVRQTTVGLYVPWGESDLDDERTWRAITALDGLQPVAAPSAWGRA